MRLNASSWLSIALLGNLCLTQYTPPIIEDLQLQPPKPVPKYMVDNTGNTYGASPDRGVVNGPQVDDEYVAAVGNSSNVPHLSKADPAVPRLGKGNGKRASSSGGSFWVGKVAHGISPFAANARDYKIFRNVKDYGAKGDGSTDDTKAINDAIVDGNRCGQKCGSTSTLGAVIYFPPGTYIVSTPIIQYYYTQFIGDANNWPTIKGTKDFQGIALIDTDVYIEGGNGAEWYINQNQFYRAIRNFNLDITNMPDKNYVHGQEFVPTCLHWQVAQSTSLQNIHFVMIQGSDKQVGIFMENGSGGFLSDLQFFGGQIGFRAGSQQYTMRGLTFRNTATAISTIWNWGMVWKEINIYNAYVAIDTQSFGGFDGQGTGSLVVQDSYWNHVPYGITLKKGTVSSAIILDNLQTDSCQNLVMNSGFADPVLAGNPSGTLHVENWSLGYQVTNNNETKPVFKYGDTKPSPIKPSILLDKDGKYFTRSRPQYESSGSVVNIVEQGVKNDGTGDQTEAINRVLSAHVGSVIVFPAGVYLVQGTVKVPTGSKITGELWPQIMGTGSFFMDEKNPKAMVQVGRKGDKGSVEISGMLFTVRGATAGCIMMEWNVHEDSQGSAAMWDSHFRIGGATGSDLSLKDCPRDATNDKCKAASMLLHVTTESSGYFENIWAWTADHDLDTPVGGADTTSATQISVFTARGILIESQGPTWLYGTSSEHHQMYQYQLSGAKNVYLGHLQTETPYYQPSPDATSPFKQSSVFADDPLYQDCVQGSNATCTEAWALRVLNSTDVFVYGAGFYSFFSSYKQGCLKGENCQQRLVDIGYTQGLWMFNTFTKGATEVISPQGGIPAITSLDTQAGFTTELAIYFAWALQGKDIGGRGGNDHKTPDNVNILPLPGCTTVAPSATFTLAASCIPAITSRPSSGPGAAQQNSPPGPNVCHEVCDIWRLLTGTCCGKGGSMSNPIYIPPNVTVPYDIPLPPGYKPSINITIPVAGGYDPTQLYGTQTLPPSSTTTTAATSQSSMTYAVGFATGVPGDPDCLKHECGCIPAGTPVDILPAGVPLARFQVIPGGTCFPGQDKDGDDPHPPPPPPPPCKGCPPGGIVINGPVKLPPVDPPCLRKKCPPCIKGVCPDGTSGGGGGGGDDGCDPDLSADTGLCPNGNFPLYDPFSNSINCDVPDDEIGQYLSACQKEADDEYDYSLDQIDCEKQSCPLPAAAKRASTGSYIMDGNYTSAQNLFPHRLANYKRQMAPPPAKRQCPPRPPPNDPGAVKPGRKGECDRVFECDTNKWPNVCNNAASAQVKRAKPTALTYMGPNARQGYVTRQWWRTHPKPGNGQEHDPKVNAQRNAGNVAGQPHGGWGLIGCEVEEYPFGNSISSVPQNERGKWANRAVLRLIPWEENRSHGNALAKFIQKAIQGDLAQGMQGLSKDGGWTYCVDITGDHLDSKDYLLGDDQEKNRCAQAHGPGFALVNDISAPEARRYPNERRWDPWFDENNQLFEHTVYSSGQSIATMMLPSQYGKFPAPGMMTYVRGANHWTTSAPGLPAVGTAVAAGVPGKKGQNLKYDTPGVSHAGIKRSIDIDDLGYDPRSVTDHLATITPPPRTSTHQANHPAKRTSVPKLESKPNPGPAGDEANKQRSKRQSPPRGGSFLDVDVYRKAFFCEKPYEDPCIAGDCFQGGVVYDSDGHVADSGSADQSGPNGQDTGDGDNDGGDGGNPPPTTTFIHCRHQDQDPGLGYTSGFCVCDKSTFAEHTMGVQTPINYCAYTTKPTKTVSIPSQTSTTKPPHPSETICLGYSSDSAIGIDSPDDPTVWRQGGNMCKDSDIDSSIVSISEDHDICEIHGKPAMICGQNATVVDVGPKLLKPCSRGFGLKINGVIYPGAAVNYSDHICADKGCHIGIGYTSLEPYIYFPDVPCPHK